MAVLNQKSVLDMIKEFRRNWHTFCNSERTTVCGADSMLLALQLSMAENNKQYSGEFTVSLSDVLLTWKYLLHEKLNLPVENMKVIDHYENIRKIYDDFLKNSNMLDMIDVYKKCNVLTSNCENYANISPNIRNEVGTAEMSQLRDFLSGRQYVVDNETDFSEPMSPISKHNQDNEKYAGLPLLWPLPLRSTGSGRAGSAATAHGPSRSAARGILPDRGTNLAPLHRQADAQPLRHQGSP
ncbi:PCNA-interacting partner isoform X7 [Physeter macrocephalus]|uniref:PCNA-interacting partner n=1 Tax=Physeter macrocephalus TaxID=9755 RepID=A0A9W2WPY9_PHYMC|nr:PCNA-interacting partner isoform X7 [Physeter catodon]